jgi:pyrimidine operon attenuation protein/uracil phosphoribosyltransferase
MPIVMDADRMGRALTRIAHEVLERNRGVEELALVGIRTSRGDWRRHCARSTVTRFRPGPSTSRCIATT